MALAGTVPALAGKVAAVAPAAKVTEAGTARAALSLLNASDAPPNGAAPDSVTVHVLEAPDARLVGVQLSPETAIAAVITVPPVAPTPRPLPSGEAPRWLSTPITYVPGEEVVTVATATMPSAIAVWFTPVKRHV